MIRVDRPIVVEGRYDKSRLASFLDATIVTTDGFAVFSDRERLALIRRLAGPCGVILLTDPDTAGFRIRNFLKGALGPDKVTHVFVPDIYGKERRKAAPSSEGKLGVEGMDRAVLLEALQKAGVLCASEEQPRARLTKTDLYELGLSGGQNSAALRRALLRRLRLPERLGANALCDVLGQRYTPQELQKLVKELDSGNPGGKKSGAEDG